MNILFIHQNFPGQFVHLAADLAREPGNKVVALTMRANPAPAGVTVRPYTLLRKPASEVHPLLREEESKVLRAEACAAAAFQLKREGFVPDVVVAHPGWGEALFIKDVFPQAKVVVYCEFYYAAEGQDVGFDPEAPPVTFEQRCRLRLRNSNNLLSMELADAAIAPTEWQKSTYPAWARDKITVIHDGIDLERVRYNPAATLTLSGPRGQHGFAAGDEVLSYVARNLEPVRGFHIFMRTLPEVLRRRPKAQVIVVGGNEVSYGHHPEGGGSWKDRLLAEVGADLDLSRVHFVGKVPYQAYLNLLSISRVHPYWTTPFVLSWSFLEAAASGVPLIASDTQPVREFVDMVGATTVPFFDRAGFADRLGEKLAQPVARTAAPRPLPHIALADCLRRQKALLRSV
ncbi:glycosyltransferase [Telluria beijingensis]|uniref:glycosyltransferase n=1 Tax=Telluria beijingensis TaxID=3068633 RepID=UPI002795EA96|nr:glycosyltransferase [Massilia sp. REN29]